MPENWKTYKFSELFETASGLSKSRDQFGFGSPFLTFKDVFYNYFLPLELGDLANTSEKEQIRGSVKRGDIFLTRTSETLHELGMSSVALKDYPNSTFNGFCKRLRQIKGSIVKIHPEFIGYFLRSNSFRNEVSSHATMTTRASLNNTSISSLSVTLPPFSEQVEISTILKALDDKIELNLQMNKTLEEMAMALYEHWFVDFGPFQDGEFVDSELGKIPEGWEVKKLKNILKFKKENIKASKFTERLPYVPIDCLASKSLTLATFKPGYEAKSSLVKFVKGDFLFGAMRPYFHKVCIAPFDGITRSTAFVFGTINDYYYSFGLCLLNQEATINFASANSQGSTIPYAKWHNIFSDMPIVLPPEVLIKKFNNELYQHFQMTTENFHEIQTLSQLRDTLLPKLISGEVRVKDVEKTLSEVL